VELTDSNGIASFGDLSIAGDGENILSATSDGLISAITDTFLIQSLPSTELNTTNQHSASFSYNYPNPFHSKTTVEFYVPVAGSVCLKVYNMTGAEIKELVNKEMLAGTYQTTFDANNLPSGIYFYVLTMKPKVKGQFGTFSETKRMEVMK
jgi:hypothetical protein